MRYAVTSRTESLVAELVGLAEAAQDRLALASAEAQREWEAVRFRWPSEVELRKGVIELSDDDLAVMRSKVMRFVSILGAVASARSSNAEIPTVERRAGANLRIELVSSGGHPRRP
jgi:hypothetical protein